MVVKFMNIHMPLTFINIDKLFPEITNFKMNFTAEISLIYVNFGNKKTMLYFQVNYFYNKVGCILKNIEITVYNYNYHK